MVSIRKFLQGIGLLPVSSSAIDTKGELEVLDSDGRLYWHDGSAVNAVISASSTDVLTNKSIDADTNTITNIENADIKALAAIDASKIADGSVSNTEFQYINSLTSNAQTQLDNIVAGTTPITLTDAHIFVGNATNDATDVAVSGDVTISNTGNVQIASGAIVNADINASAAIDFSKLAALPSADILVGSVGNVATAVAVTGDISLSNTGVTAYSGTVPVNKGGTGDTSLTAHGVLIGQGTSAVAVTATGTAGQVLQSGGASADPTYSTPTYPSASGSAGKILRADGTNNVYSTATYPDTTTANQILYSSATNTISQITTANTSALVTNSSGVPSLTSGGTANRLLRTDGTTISFAQAALATDVSGTLGVTNGGTGQTSYTDGQLLIGNSTGNTLTKATITAGTNITVTNGNGSITIASTGGGGAPTFARVTGNAGATASNTPIKFPTVSEDASSIYSTGTGQATVPSGKTFCMVRWYTTGDNTNRIISAYKNGSKISDGSNNDTLGSGIQNGTAAFGVTAGDSVDIRPSNTMTGNANANATFMFW